MRNVLAIVMESCCFRYYDTKQARKQELLCIAAVVFELWGVFTAICWAGGNLHLTIKFDLIVIQRYTLTINICQIQPDI